MFCLFFRLNEIDETQEEKKENGTKKKKKKNKSIKNVFKEEVVPKTSDKQNGEKVKNVDQTQNEHKVNKTPKERKVTKNKKMNKPIKNVFKVEDVLPKNNDELQNRKTNNSKQLINKTRLLMKNGKKGQKQKFSVKKYKPNKEPSALESMSDDRLKAYGINPKKFRNKLRFGNNQ